MKKNGSIEVYGTVTDSLGGDRFRVELDGGSSIIAYPCGKIRMNHIRIIVGDSVRVEMSPYDLTKGRISRRM